ncbi:hypothetical protein U1Q18_023896, partial [Sarracenia purpurea var. burkii]
KVFEMEYIGLFKQGWKWLQSKRYCHPVARTTVICCRDKIGIFMERHWPLELGHLWGLVLPHCML